MLRELTIENIAIVKKETIRFGGDLSVITGETGAGKSIIIDCIGLIMGDRASRELVRSGEKRACVSALFQKIPEHVISSIASLGISCGSELVLSRELALSSDSLSSVCRIDGKPVTATMMREVAARLLNLHTQHASQTLMNDENHILYLDGFADVSSLLESYKKIYDDACEKERAISALKKSEQEKARLSDMLKFQINEIRSVSPKPGEEEALSAAAVKIRNAEAISKHSRIIKRALYSGEKSLSARELIDKAITSIESLGDVIKDSPSYIDALGDIKFKLEDIAETIISECETDIDDPTSSLDKIELRLDAISSLKRKYGADIESIIAFRENAEKELSDIESADDKIEDIKNELRHIYASLKSAAEELTSKRKSAAIELAKRISSELSDLEMDKVKFEIDVKPMKSYSPLGIDEVTFLVSTNTGEPLLPLSKIASGGELSRLMLALKCALADKEMTQTHIFDEIDTGISGRTSLKIGLKLRSCAKTCQVICVTHSPQIASTGSEHLLVSKHETALGRTESSVKVLERSERIKEISRIIGGEKITEKTVLAATEMLDAASGSAL